MATYLLKLRRVIEVEVTFDDPGTLAEARKRVQDNIDDFLHMREFTKDESKITSLKKKEAT